MANWNVWNYHFCSMGFEMKTIDFPKFKDYTNQVVRYIQPKFDGHLTKIYKPESGLWQAYTKNDKNISEKLIAISHIESELANLPCDSVVFAELHCPTCFATDIPGMLNDSNSDLRLTAFAAPVFSGHGRDYAMDLIEVMSWLKACGIEVPGTELIHPRREISQDRLKKLLEQAKELKLEGWVLKEGHMYGWYKLKPIRTVDAFVVAIHQSWSGTHFGGLKSIGVAIWETPTKMQSLGNVGSGFKCEYRKQFDTEDKRSKLMGRVCEVAYDSVAACGKLRFPRFIRWREDKEMKNCTIDQLEN